MQNELEMAKQNGHEPGHLFPGIRNKDYHLTQICFCQRCDKALVYKDIHTDKVMGDFNSKCDGVN